MSLIKNLLIYLTIQLLSLACVRAGEIVMTTSDGAPTYKNGTEVVIGTSSPKQGAPGTSVTLTTTCINGTVSVAYIPSSGVTRQSDTGAGSTCETTVFSFDSTTVGVVNTIQARINHNATTANGSPCLPHDATITFTICVPEVIVARPPGDTTSNSYSGFLFHTAANIIGCDDFTQIQFVQLIQETGCTTDYYGNVTSYNLPAGTIDDPSYPSGWVSPGGSGGWPFKIIGQTARFIGNDVHASKQQGINSVTLGTSTYDYTELQSCACKFQDEIRRTGASAILGEFDWSYTWDNYNDRWPTPSLAAFSATTGYTTASYGGVHPGTAPGEFSNVSGVSIP